MSMDRERLRVLEGGRERQRAASPAWGLALIVVAFAALLFGFLAGWAASSTLNLMLVEVFPWP
jgi:type VI protein secretion system component VasF